MEVESLWRYPVKGLSPEPLPQVDLSAGQGVPLDRAYAVTDGSFVFDPQHPEPMPKTRFLMLAKYERLARLETRLDADAETLSVAGDGPPHTFRLGDAAGRDALATFLAGFLDVPLPGPAAVVRAEGHQFTDVSVHSPALMRSISLINLATVRDLGQQIGQALDPRRFRANLYFDGAAPWSELDWVGRTLQCGSVRLRVVRRTRRCPATSVDPATGIRDLNLPLAIRDYRGHTDCGIYAEVVSGGRVGRGDALSLAPEAPADAAGAGQAL